MPYRSFSIDIKGNKKEPDAGASENSMETRDLSGTHLSKLLEDGEFVVTSEIGLPRGSDSGIIKDTVAGVRDYCDAVNVPDNPMGNPSMSSTVSAYFVLQMGAEPVLQICTRDRNRIAIQSELFAAYALGIRNVLFISGDHSRHGSEKLARCVYDINSVEALRLARSLMTGFDILGEELEGTPSFFLGSTFNPYEEPIEAHVIRTEEKQLAGARFFQTQGIFDVAPFVGFLERVSHLDLDILAGVIPLQSPEMARFMNEFVPGIIVPDRMIDRLDDAAEGLEEEEEELLAATRPVGIEIALETIEELRSIEEIRGLHIMGVGWADCVGEIVKRAGLYPRPK